MQLRSNQPGTFSMQPEDAEGNATSLETGAVVQWAINDPSLATLAPSSDGLSCVVTPIGKMGATQVTVSVAAVGNEAALQGTADLNVIAGEATQIVLSGTPS
jgi:hypothetical protein